MKSAQKLGFVVGMTSAIFMSGAYISQAQAAQLNLVQNGDFELDPLVNPDYDPTLPNPFITGWSNNSLTDIDTYSIRLSNYPNPATNGLRSVEFSYSPPGGALPSLSQTLATNKNNKYRLSFSLASVEEAPRLDNLFQVFIGGKKRLELTNLTLDIDPLKNFKKYTVDFVATSKATELKFAGRTGHDWLNLDDVSVYKIKDGNAQSVPEPTAAGGIAVAGLFGSWLKRKKLAST